MRRLFDPWHATPEPCAVAVGTFDGVHRGHRHLLARLRAAADRRTLPTTVLTFAPHPRAVVCPEAASRMIASLERRLDLLEATGAVDRVFVLRFDEQERRRTAESFVHDLLVARLGMCALVVGENFACGHRRAGDAARLAALGSALGFAFLPVPLHAADAVPCSSSAVRRLIASGDIARASRMLGRPILLDRAQVAAVEPPGTARLRLPADACVPEAGAFRADFRCDARAPWIAAVIRMDPPAGARTARWATLHAADTGVLPDRIDLRLLGQHGGPRAAIRDAGLHRA